MSVVVRMEMPKACSWIENGEKKKCPISEWGGACAITKQFNMPDGCRPSWCPIICSLPEGHGRLVDSELVKEILKPVDSISHYEPEWTWSELHEINCVAIDNAPTIVPAEEKPEPPKEDKNGN